MPTPSSRRVAVSVVVMALASGPAADSTSVSPHEDRWRFSLKQGGPSPTVVGADDITSRVRFVAQPDAPVVVTRLDLTDSVFVAGGGSYTWEPRYSVEIMNVSDQTVGKVDVMVRTFCDGSGAGAGTTVTGPIQPSQRASSKAALGRAQGTQPSCTTDVQLLVLVDAVEFSDCLYKPSQTLPRPRRTG
jgi:hypothetical protein